MFICKTKGTLYDDVTTPSLDGNNSEFGAKDVNLKMSWGPIGYGVISDINTIYFRKIFDSLLETYAQNTEILVRQKTMMLQEEKQRVNYLLSLFLPENQVSKDRISAAEISPHYIKNFRLKLFIKMFACPLKDMITVQFLILTLSVLLKYQRYGYFITKKRTFVRLIRTNPLFSFRAPNKYSLCWNHYLHFMMIHSLGIQNSFYNLSN